MSTKGQIVGFDISAGDVPPGKVQFTVETEVTREFALGDDVFIAQPAALSASAIPPGWQTIPQEPTREMWAACADALVNNETIRNFGGLPIAPDFIVELVFRTALEAAPHPVHAGAVEGWQTIDSAPKDGTEVVLPYQITRGVKAFWCEELRTWVLSRPLNVESIWAPEYWRPVTPPAVSTPKTGER